MASQQNLTDAYRAEYRTILERCLSRISAARKQIDGEKSKDAEIAGYAAHVASLRQCLFLYEEVSYKVLDDLDRDSPLSSVGEIVAKLDKHTDWDTKHLSNIAGGGITNLGPHDEILANRRKEIRELAAGLLENNKGERSIQILNETQRNADSWLKNHQKSVESLLATLRGEKVKEEVSDVGAKFASWAKRHRNSSRWLLGAIGIVAISAAVCLSLTFLPEPPSGENAAPFYVSMGVMRFTILTLAVTFITFLARQYSAANHARLVAEHRHKIAETYMELRKAGVIGESNDVLLGPIIGALVKEPTSPLVKGGEVGDGGLSAADLAAIASIAKKQQE